MPIIGHFEFDRVKKIQGASSPENSHFVLKLWSSRLARFTKYRPCVNEQDYISPGAPAPN